MLDEVREVWAYAYGKKSRLTLLGKVLLAPAIVCVIAATFIAAVLSAVFEIRD